MMSKSAQVNIIDCPRDAIQGIEKFIPTANKINHINNLIKSNLFEYIDFGSFVSPKAVPQMQDTDLVIEGIEKTNNTKLLAIIANLKGAEIAKNFQKIDYLGYPFSISETFQQRNTNASIYKSYETVYDILNLLNQTNQELVLYLSMAFGNPYADNWHEELVLNWLTKLQRLGIKRFSIADTTGEATPDLVKQLFKLINEEFPSLHLNIHLHSRKENAMEKIEAAYEAGCTNFEGAILGYGGCPFAQDDLVGNISTELLLKKFGIGKDVEINNLKISFLDTIR